MQGCLIIAVIGVILIIIFGDNADIAMSVLFISFIIGSVIFYDIEKASRDNKRNRNRKLNSTEKETPEIANPNAPADVAVVKLSLKQYQSIQQAVRRGYNFCGKISKDTKFREAFIRTARNIYPNYNEEDFATTLRFFLAKDFFDCFGHLGHDLHIIGTNVKHAEINYADPTGQALFATLESMNKREKETDYMIFREAILSVNHKSIFPDAEKYRKTIEKTFSVYLNSGASIRIPGKEDFNLVLVFIACDKAWCVPEIRKIYYHFAEAVSLADNDKDGTETAWLNQLKQKIDEDSLPVKSKTSIGEKKITGYESNPMEQLNELIGLSQVKTELETLSRFIEICRKRREAGLRVADISYHCVFAGNPGTGKTTVARILASIYKQLGILSTGQLVEADRSGLVAEYMGQTAVKTNNIIDKAIGGVLFIDEAYTLAQGGENDYGKEAIATLLKRMEDDRDKLVVILAGYTNEIEAFINSNPGLRSRFNRYIHFEDYTDEELFKIFLLQAKKYEYTLDANAQQQLRSLLHQKVMNKQKDFGNARYVRNLFEKVIENQAVRLSNSHGFNKDLLAVITKEDIHE